MQHSHWMEWFFRPLGLTVGFVYPAYASYKALETASSENASTWLTYWVVFTLFTLFEYLGDWVLSSFSFYYVLKVVFVVWLQMPPVPGATKVFVNYLQPLLKRHEQSIDRALDEGFTRAETGISTIRSRIGALTGGQGTLPTRHDDGR